MLVVLFDLHAAFTARPQHVNATLTGRSGRSAAYLAFESVYGKSQSS